MKKLLISLSMLSGCLLVNGNAATLQVPQGYPAIQDAITASADGDVVVVDAAGSPYAGNIDLMGKAITIRSANPADPAVVKATVIDGGLFFNGFIFQSGEGSATVVDGLTITNAGGFWGGALVCMMDSVSTFRGSSPTIRNCVIVNNSAWSDGAGLYCDYDCSPVIEYCQFLGNNSGVSGGAISISGGNPTLNHCQFIGNNSGWWGGAVSAFMGSFTLRDCVLANNYAVLGGAIDIQESVNPQILNCTVIDNLATEEGSAVYAGSTVGLKIENSIFWGNTTSALPADDVTIFYSGQNAGDAATIAYCNIQGGSSKVQHGIGTVVMNDQDTVTLDPLFVKNGSFTATGQYVPGDWHLQKKSPCINKGNPAVAVTAGETDIDGESRIMNGRIEIGTDEVEIAIAAKINIVPGALLAPSKGFLMAMIRLPEGYAVKDIDAKSIRLNGTLAAQCFYRNHYSAVALFDTEKVYKSLGDVEGKVELTVTGQLTDETAFAGSDTVQVIQIQWKNWLKRLCNSAGKK